MNGKMIVLDGNDGSGKHTQAEMLRSALIALGKKVLPISFPRYEDTFFGRELRKALAGKYGNFTTLDPHLGALLYAADRWASKPVLQQALDEGVYVICDRYASANQIHQGGKVRSVVKRDDFLAWLEQLEFGEFKIPKPDVSIYLDVPPAISAKLMSDKTRDIVEDNPRYLKNSHEAAQWLIKRNPKKWIHIRCTDRGRMLSRMDIHKDIMERLKDRNLF